MTQNLNISSLQILGTILMVNTCMNDFVLLTISCLVAESDTSFDPYEPLAAMATGEAIGSLSGGLLEPALGADNLSSGAVSWNHI